MERYRTLAAAVAISGLVSIGIIAAGTSIALGAEPAQQSCTGTFDRAIVLAAEANALAALGEQEAARHLLNQSARVREALAAAGVAQ